MIYYLEDDEQIRNLTLYTLAQTGHETQGFSCAAELYKAIEHAVPDLFILDVMLPGEDGISVLKKLRACEGTADVPVMMLTAKSTEFDTVTGLTPARTTF
ncbi:MAG: response regulator [Slackia sp.]